MMLTNNMTGTAKKKSLVTKYGINLRWYKDVTNLPVNYALSRNSWMTIADILLKLGKQLKINIQNTLFGQLFHTFID